MRLLLSAASLGLAAQVALAQGASSSGATLSLDDAIAMAKRNNPGYLTQVNARRTADAQLRATYGGLLPSANVSFNSGYQQGGTQFIQGIPFTSSDVLTSSYSLGISYLINVAALAAPKLQRANRAAVEADISSNVEALRTNVTTFYLSALQAEALSNLQDTLVLTAQLQLDMAKAKMSVGSGTILDVRSAEVTLGTVQINQLTARTNVEVTKVQLYQQIGADEPPGVRLTTTFPMAVVPLTLESVLAKARAQNPALASARLHGQAAALQVREAQGAYTPTLSLNTGLGGNSFQYRNSNFLVSQALSGVAAQNANCLTLDSIRTAAGLAPTPCGPATLTAQQQQTIRDGNNNWPFRFQRNPVGLSATLSLPVFNGFARENTLQQAIVARDNQDYTIRTQELQITAAVTQAYLQLQLAEKTIGLREQNAQMAAEQLQFAEERYRVGQATFLDLTTARGTYEQALIDRLNAIYDYHKAFTTLESAVGRPLR